MSAWPPLAERAEGGVQHGLCACSKLGITLIGLKMQARVPGKDGAGRKGPCQNIPPGNNWRLLEHRGGLLHAWYSRSCSAASLELECERDVWLARAPQAR